MTVPEARSRAAKKSQQSLTSQVEIVSWKVLSPALIAEFKSFKAFASVSNLSLRCSHAATGKGPSEPLWPIGHLSKHLPAKKIPKDSNLRLASLPALTTPQPHPPHIHGKQMARGAAFLTAAPWSPNSHLGRHLEHYITILKPNQFLSFLPFLIIWLRNLLKAETASLPTFHSPNEKI